MKVGQYFSNQLSIRLGQNLFRWEYKETSGFYKAKGVLKANDNLKHPNAECEIIVVNDSFKQMPIITCNSPWIRRHEDWHAGEGGILCYELPDRWTDELTSVYQQIGFDEVLNCAEAWVMNSLRCLLARHYCGYKNLLEEWPKEWSEWGHDDIGPKQYRKFKNER